ncbi:MAG: Hsp70 family protein [Proteobacteria bacterium]|nr:Hsp70 family protein [Pseudomonadota bacterium]
MATRLGIDYGTTRTVVSVVDDGRHPIAAFDDGGEFRDHIPGIAALVEGELLVGWAAARALADGTAQHAIRSIKRATATLPADAPVPGLPGITALALVTAFLADVRRAIVESSNVEIDADGILEVMAAVPASAASCQRWSTLEALRRAGFTPIGLINEPTAAAIEFAHRHLGELGKKSPKRYVVVYDLGGGTFDTSAVSLEGRRFELLASEGIGHLGGDDFDELIVRAAGREPTPALLERARAAKETLQPSTKRLLVDLDDGPAVTLDVADVYRRAEPLVAQTIAQTELLFGRLRERGIDPDDPRELGGIYLVGGGASFPAVARALRARFGRKLQLAAQPFAATAVGLAIAADPDAHVVLREAVTRHFGVWREGDSGDDKIFDPLIGKGTTSETDAPIVVRRRYRPTHAIGHLRFLECGSLDDGGQPIQDLVPWKDVYFPYDPALADRVELASVPNQRRPDLMTNEIAETYTFALDGTISVLIENRSRGYARSFDLGALR